MSAVEELLPGLTSTKLADQITVNWLPKLAVSLSRPSSSPGQRTDSHRCKWLAGRRLRLLGCYLPFSMTWASRKCLFCKMKSHHDYILVSPTTLMLFSNVCTILYSLLTVVTTPSCKDTMGVQSLPLLLPTPIYHMAQETSGSQRRDRGEH